MASSQPVSQSQQDKCYKSFQSFLEDDMDICDSSHRVPVLPIQVGKPYFRRNEILFAECVIPRRETGTDRPTLPEYPVAHPYVECIGQSFNYISQVLPQMQPLDSRISV
ncbi:unnamed protein product [Cyprideis torosa]|uniref:Uncharacterized protein n=1 Tax=Cyprideis torosa TaxID=163714 RepID=A0A7R8ZRG1_9CRUS|nr:unnamed protein product [Cyprideis torosa]CAG0898838.1 unnamed protein product [Cyprideis torosa]